MVREGQKLSVEKLEGEAGGNVTFDNVYLVADEEKGDVRLGDPVVAGAKVEATIDEHGRGKKITVIKYKPKIRYRKKQGHRQDYTGVTINKIVTA